MPKKHSYEFVKCYIEQNGCQLISKEYTNCETPIEIQCKCGNVFKKSFKKFIAGQTQCKECSFKEASIRNRTPFERVLQDIEDSGCKYISGDYVNNQSELTIQCKCGNIYKRNYNHFKRGQHECLNCSRKKLSQSKIKYTKQDVIKILSERGFKLLDDDYINTSTNIKCCCKNGHVIELKITNFISNRFGCPICAREYFRGENASNYKNGGNRELVEYLRQNIKEWKVDVQKKYKNRCFLTNSKEYVIHHLNSFNVIVHESLDELNLPTLSKINQYKKEDLDRLTSLVRLKHKTNNGVLIQRKIHNEFHNIYRKGNNTTEQFIDFLQKNYPQKVDEFLSTIKIS